MRWCIIAKKLATQIVKGSRYMICNNDKHLRLSMRIDVDLKCSHAFNAL